MFLWFFAFITKKLNKQKDQIKNLLSHFLSSIPTAKNNKINLFTLNVGFQHLEQGVPNLAA